MAARARAGYATVPDCDMTKAVGHRQRTPDTGSAARRAHASAQRASQRRTVLTSPVSPGCVPVRDVSVRFRTNPRATLASASWALPSDPQLGPARYVSHHRRADPLPSPARQPMLGLFESVCCTGGSHILQARMGVSMSGRLLDRQDWQRGVSSATSGGGAVNVSDAKTREPPIASENKPKPSDMAVTRRKKSASPQRARASGRGHGARPVSSPVHNYRDPTCRANMSVRSATSR